MQLDITTMEQFHVLPVGYFFVEWLFVQPLMHVSTLAIVGLLKKPETSVGTAGTKSAYTLEWIQAAFMEVDMSQGN